MHKLFRLLNYGNYYLNRGPLLRTGNLLAGFLICHQWLYCFSGDGESANDVLYFL